MLLTAIVTRSNAVRLLTHATADAHIHPDSAAPTAACSYCASCAQDLSWQHAFTIFQIPGAASLTGHPLAMLIVADTDQHYCLTQVILKCADIGHLTAAPKTHKRWAVQLEEEFFRQARPLHWFCSQTACNVPACGHVPLDP